VNIIIAGGGKFGYKAAMSLKEIAKIVVVDANPKCYASSLSHIELVIGDAIEYITELMMNKIIPDYIVPCIPGNLVAKIFINFMSKFGFKVIKDEKNFINALQKIKKDVIIIADKDSATIVASYAKDFICPSNCKSPKICPMSNKIIDPLYSILNIGENGKIFVSKLLNEGVGGISGRELYEELIFRMKIGGSFYIGTACECHGIVNFLRID